LTFAGCATHRHEFKADGQTGSNGGVAVNSTAADPMLDHLAGQWVLSGEFGGKKATHDVDAEWFLGREYMRLHEASRDRTADGRPDYEAVVLLGLNPRSGEHSCLWLDSTGAGGLAGDAIGHGKATGGTIPFLFKFASGARFHTTFIYASETDTWQWIMDDEEGGVLQPFGRATLTRKR
jgi:hypothetical protein